MRFVRGKQRPRFDTREGNSRMYTPTRTLRDQKSVAEAYQNACREACGMLVIAPKGEPVAVRIDTYRKLPKSMPKRIKRQPDTAGGKDNPDLDNVVKLVLDGLNGMAWVDDCQVTRIVAERHDRTRREGDLMIVQVGWGGDEPLVGLTDGNTKLEWNGRELDVETMTFRKEKK